MQPDSKRLPNVLKANDEKRWSFTDCTSFAIMRQLGVREAFAFDMNHEEAVLYQATLNPR